ncbi:AraC family transcriptional regulator [Shewanella donghaensis]|uniref:AraC family transcriptional regulator n=1 Tax=Shewanella donghaensis TaxID=238836 RepID=UPI0011833609|nr:GyrI-like domain-containing protein [Shewanella donghaensis]
MKELNTNFEKVLNYIDNHLNQPLAINTLAQLAEVPEAHFSFLFYSLFHTRPEDYISLLRNIEAAQTLGFDKTAVIAEVAKQAGFSSIEAFTFAFSNNIGQSPQNFQNNPDWGNFFAKQKPLSTLSEGHDKLTNELVGIELVEREAIDIVAIEHRGPERFVSQSVQSLIAFRQKHRLSPSTSRTFNFIYDIPTSNKLTASQELYRIDIGASLSKEQLTSLESVLADSDHFVHKQLIRSDYAMFTHCGSHKELHAKIKFLYSEWLPHSGKRLTHLPLIFERLDIVASTSETTLDANKDKVHLTIFLQVD